MQVDAGHLFTKLTSLNANGVGTAYANLTALPPSHAHQLRSTSTMPVPTENILLRPTSLAYTLNNCKRLLRLSLIYDKRLSCLTRL